MGDQNKKKPARSKKEKRQIKNEKKNQQRVDPVQEAIGNKKGK